MRARVDGSVVDLGDELALDRAKTHDLDVVVDRLVVKEGLKGRLTDSVELALKLGEGRLLVQSRREEPFWMSERFACIDCGISLPPIEPRMFSFNGPHGACPACDGLGARDRRRSRALIGDAGRTLREGVVSRGGGAARRARDRAGARGRGARREPRRAVVEAARGAAQARSSSASARGGRARRATKPKRGATQPSYEGIVPRLERASRGASRSATTRTSPTATKAASPTTSWGAFWSRARATPARAGACAPRRWRSSWAKRHRRARRHAAARTSAQLRRERSAAHARATVRALRAARARHRRAAAQGGGRAPGLPHRRGPRLPHARPQRADALVGRGAAHSPRDADRRRARGRPLRARRAQRRPPRARQRAAHRGADSPARPRQHGLRRRARPRGHPRGRLRRRHGARRGRATAATIVAAGHAGRDDGRPESITGPWLSRQEAAAHSRPRARRRSKASVSVVGARAHNLQDVDASTSRSASSPA